MNNTLKSKPLKERMVFGVLIPGGAVVFMMAIVTHMLFGVP